MRRVVVAILAGVIALLQIGPAAAQAPCQFVLGFAALRSLIPLQVGACLDNQQTNVQNGDALQRTTGGLLVWRKADNWTAFTDGYRTWINGPLGLQSRLNTECYPWEVCAPGAAPVTAPGAAPAPAATLVPTPGPSPTAVPNGSTRERPVPRGFAADGGDGWRIGILGATLNANEAVRAANPANPPPAAGRQFVLVRLSVARTGTAAQAFAGVLQLLGAANAVYAPSSASAPACGVVPDPLPAVEVATGTRIVGNVCWSVPTAEVGALLLRYTTGTTPPIQIHFALA